MSEEKAEVTMSRKEYDSLKRLAEGKEDTSADGALYDSRGYETAEGVKAADVNRNGIIEDPEMKMRMEFKRKELEDADAMRDSQRRMAWFALIGMLLYPAAVVTASMAGLDEAQSTLGDMAPTYFVAVAGIVAAFFGAQAYNTKKK